MHRRSSWVGVTVLVGALALAGCGGDDDQADGHNHPLEMGDASYPEAKCPEDTPEFAIDMKAEGNQHHIVGRLVDADPAPPLLHYNDWVVAFEDASGNPIDDVEVTMARPWMPVHGHDGFYAPIVTATDEPGQFDIKRINMWMRGPWLVQLTVSSESAGDDYIEFKVCID